MSAKCNSCDAPIIWALTENGKRMPVDAEPVRDGNIVLEHHGQRVTAIVRDAMLPGLEPLYKSHFATCPNASTHRRTTGK